MIERFKSRPTLAALAAAAITALGVGGVAVAQSGTTTPDQPSQAQSGPAEQENTAADRDNVQDENGKDDANEKGEANDKGEANEKAEGPERADGAEGSEKADDDGPGGHADEPANPNANNQAQGQQ